MRRRPARAACGGLAAILVTGFGTNGSGLPLLGPPEPEKDRYRGSDKRTPARSSILPICRSERFRRRGRWIRRSMTSDEPISPLRLAICCSPLLPLCEAPSSTLRLPGLLRVRSLIAERPDFRQDIADLEHVPISTAGRWRAQFRAAFGTSPTRFRTMRQLDHVRRLMKSGVSLAEAALDAGFAEQSHMSRQFKRAYGLTPAHWAAALHRTACLGSASGPVGSGASHSPQCEGPHQSPQNDRWPWYQFYGALQRLKSPMRYICEIERDFRVFQHNLPNADIEIVFGIITVGLSFASKVTRTRSASRQQAVDG